jgi:hypothetical protein
MLQAYCYRLYVGEATVDRVIAILARFPFGATVYPQAAGLWEGSVEPSIVVEIVSDRDDLDIDLGVHTIATALAREFNQDCVLVTRSDCTIKLVSK